MNTKTLTTAAFLSGLLVLVPGCDEQGRANSAVGLGEGQTDEPPAGEDEGEGDAGGSDADDTGSDDSSGEGDTGADDVPPDDFPEPGQLEPEVPFDLDKRSEVCARGNGDRVAQALCGGGEISSMTGLLATLAFNEPFFSMTANSSSLVGRDVSALNPRLIVGEMMTGSLGEDAGSHGSTEDLMALGFVRGEQLVELVGYDPSTDALNFYLLMFEQGCNGTEAGCQTSDLVSPAIESDWTGWTVYQDTDLENTSLDCNVCHQPLGPGTPKIPRLQEISNSWTHWFPTRPAQQGGGWSSGGSGTTGLAPMDPGKHGTRSSEVLWDQFISMHGDDPTYGGVPIEQIRTSAAGPEIETFVRSWLSSRTDVPQALQIPAFGSGQGNDYFCDSSSMEREGESSSWGPEFARVVSGERLPLPSHRIDITSELTRDEVVETYKAVQSGALPSGEMVHPSAAIAYTAMSEMSIVPPQDATGEQILTHMCARCHNSNLDQTVSRARFDATNLAGLDGLQKAVIADRIQRHEGDNFQMPPRRSGTMPQWAVTRVLEYLEQ